MFLPGGREVEQNHEDDDHQEEGQTGQPNLLVTNRDPVEYIHVSL